MIPPRPTTTTLLTSPLLAELPESKLDWLAAVAIWRNHQPGELICLQNEATNSVYFIIAGFLKIMHGGREAAEAKTGGKSERRRRPRQEVMVALLGPGDMVGEIAALLDTGRSASVVALTPCQVVIVPSQDFLACIHHHPSFALAVTRKMARRLIDANRQIELMRGNLEGRIHALLRHCTAIGLDTERWLSNAEIARMVGATRVAVSPIMGKLSNTRD